MILILKKIYEDEKLLIKIALGISVVWIIAQIVLIVCFWGKPQRSDMGVYISIAQRCFDNEQLYPMAEDVYSKYYIYAPGFINYLILQLRIFGTLNFNSVLNLFLNIAILLEIYYLGKKFFSERTGLISVIIFCLFSSNLLIVLGANTENPFLFLCLSALCLVFSRKWKYVIAAALLFAFANWIRPLAIIFLFASAVYFFITKTKFYNYITLIIPYILVLFIIGTITERKIGYFVYQSTTSGISLLATSHDNTKGLYNGYVFRKGGIGFIENSELITFEKRDSILRNRSFEWIKAHPVKYIALFFIKIPALYVHDSWAHCSHWGDITTTNFLSGIDTVSKNLFIKELLKKILLSVPYYIAIAFSFYALYINRKKIFAVKLIFLIILVTGTLVTCIFAIMPRYHYPYIFAVIIYAAWGIDTLIERKLHQTRE